MMAHSSVMHRGRMVQTGESLEHASDDELLLLVVRRDQAAYECLFNRHYPKMCQFAIKIVGQHDLAEEVVDDAMYVVWKNARKFRGQSTVSTWMHGIAYRLCKKALSKRARSAFSDAQDVLDMLEDGAPTPAEVSSGAEERRLLESAMRRLGFDHRATVEFVAMGHSYADIAQIMDCPENTVKTRMFHARAQLRSMLDAANGSSRR